MLASCNNNKIINNMRGEMDDRITCDENVNRAAAGLAGYEISLEKMCFTRLSE